VTRVTRVHDVIGVGLGPFNLGLAALLEPTGLDAVFFEAGPAFSWHPGLMLDGVALQVPFLADLVTLADPASRFSFLNYLHAHDRLYRFYFYERFHVPRREYEAYCRWVAEQLPGCRFSQRVLDVRPDGDRWVVRTHHAGGDEEHLARAVVVGVGTRPVLPGSARPHAGPDVFHSAAYLRHRARVLDAGRVTVIGSGQSAGEIVADLLTNAPDARIDWFTRSAGFLPMEYSKLGLEHFSPEYIDWFHGLPEGTRDWLRAGQDLLYKGLSATTSARIYDTLYERSATGDEPDVHYRAWCELRSVAPLEPTSRRFHVASARRGDGPRWRLQLRHVVEERDFTHDTDVLVLATGYEPAPLPLADPDVIERDEAGRPVIERDYRVRLRGAARSTLFVQHADLHSHGIGAPDLGLGAHRNACIVNALCGREVYRVPSRTVFQRFGAPSFAATTNGRP